jgi:tetratricopeptide (TPR) repeat protein
LRPAALSVLLALQLLAPALPAQTSAAGDSSREYSYFERDLYLLDVPEPEVWQAQIIKRIRDAHAGKSWSDLLSTLDTGIELTANRSGKEVFLARLLTLRGLYYTDRVEHGKAEADLQRAYRIVKRLGNRAELRRSAENLANHYSRLHQLERALSYFSEAYDNLAPDESLPKLVILTNIALLYSRTGDYSRALEYSDQALALRNRVENQRPVLSLLINRSKIFAHLGRREDQLAALIAAKELNTRLEVADSAAVILSNLSDYYLESKDWENARRYAREALEISSRLKNPYNRGLALGNYGIALSKLGQHEEGLAALQESLTIFESQKNQSLIIELVRVIAEAHADAGDPVRALEVYKKHKQLSDEYFFGQRQALVAEYEGRFEEVRKKKDIELLTKENELHQAVIERQRLIVMVVLIVLALVILVAVVFIRGKRRVAQANSELVVANQELQQALQEVKTLRGLLPICSSCKKVRDDKGYWNQIEAYIMAYSEAEFTHTICPQCAAMLYPEYADTQPEQSDSN